MIKLTQTQINILNKPNIEAFYCLQIKKGNTFKRLSTYFRDITLSDGRIFTANSKIAILDPPRISTQVDREQYSIGLTDPDFEFGFLSEQGLVGCPIEVLLVFINPDTNLPITNINDVLLMYRGQIDFTRYQIETQELGEVMYTINCASPIANLEATKAFYNSRSFMRNNINPSDSAFDHVYQGTGKIRLKWGRI
jgi:hypothetical protein